MSSLLAVIVAATMAPPLPRLCVSVRIETHDPASVPTPREVLRALTARLPSGARAETDCTAAETDPVWVLTVGLAPGLAVWTLEGSGVFAQRRVVLAGDNAAQDAQLLALAVVEVLRPVMEAATVSTATADPARGEAVSARNGAEQSSGVAAGPPAPGARPWSLSLGSGVSWGSGAALLVPFAQARLGRAAGPLSLVGGLGWRLLRARERFGVSMDGSAIDLAVGAQWRGNRLEARASLVGSVWLLGVTARPPLLAVDTPTIWTYGVEIAVGYALWRRERISVGVTALATGWLARPRLLVRGRTLAEGAVVELSAGPEISVDW